MKSANQFEAKNYTLKVLLSAAYNLSAPEILGGPDWVDSDRYDILGKTPGDARPTPDQQMAMLRKLIADRFDLAFHGERRETSIYSLTVAKNGPKLTESKAPPDTPAERRPLLRIRYFAARRRMPGRDASMAELATVLQRSIDHPVVDQTGLSGRYDFDLEFLPDDTQFNGALRDVIKPEAARHTSQEFVTFLQEVVGHGKPPQEIHIFVDNLSAHKTSKVEDFLHPSPGSPPLHAHLFVLVESSGDLVLTD